MLRSELNLDVTNFLDYYDDNDNLVEGRKTLLGLDENGMPVIQVGNDIHKFERTAENIEFAKSLMQKLGELYDN